MNASLDEACVVHKDPALRQADFMLSNPPYGKSWKSDLERMGGKKGMRDPRFIIGHAVDPEFSIIIRSSDGQMLFPANMLSRMKNDTPLGSRIAEVHNGSSLSTGDAGQGESNIRRWILENDWLEAIVALPLDMFYEPASPPASGCRATAGPLTAGAGSSSSTPTRWSHPLPKNLGRKKRELTDDDVARICDAFLAFEETGESKISRTRRSDTGRSRRASPAPRRRRPGARVLDLRDPRSRGISRSLAGRAGRHPEDPPKAEPDPLRGLFPATIGGRSVVVEYEPDSDLRDTEQIPLLEDRGIDAFLRREVLPYAEDPWYLPDSVKTGFTRYFHRPEPLRPLEEIQADILAIERETEGLRAAILGGESRDDRQTETRTGPLRHIIF